MTKIGNGRYQVRFVLRQRYPLLPLLLVRSRRALGATLVDSGVDDGLEEHATIVTANSATRTNGDAWRKSLIVNLRLLLLSKALESSIASSLMDCNRTFTLSLASVSRSFDASADLRRTSLPKRRA
jgi:hypothetical protein